MNFAETQKVFTQHMRDPSVNPAPENIEDRRMEIYRGLLFRNVEGFMSNSFPVLRKIYADDDWQKLIRDYFREHESHTPYFPKMPQEFLLYLENERVAQDDDYPFLLELAHYEWVEMSIALDSRTIDDMSYDAEGDLLDGVPVLNPVVQLLAYEYPVHKIGPDYLPEEKPEQPTYLLVYRDAHDDVGFIELNPVSARLLDLINQDTGHNSRQLLQAIAEELQHSQPEQVIQGGLQILQNLHEKGILLGTQA